MFNIIFKTFVIGAIAVLWHRQRRTERMLKGLIGYVIRIAKALKLKK